ncbi:MAG: choice-of-anchor J domain-containing protein [Prevotella sp.]|nr:choice-of-anchor J domain-containing protein [Prevotella sp.]MCM1074481.1 choice-of-anchor J domain-containing protein [Ruminococcus sp.]
MMRKLLFSMLAGVSVSAIAQTTTPAAVFSENFRSSCVEGTLPAGWVTYGSGQISAAKWVEYFGDKGEAPYYRPLSIEGVDAAWSNTTYRYAETGDEWLVTPKIHIDNDSQLLQFTANAFGGFETNRYRVLISETGQAKEDFRVSPLINTTLKGTTTEVYKKTSYVALNGYAGKDIYLAFVNKSTDADLLGFTDIEVSPYAINLQNLTPEVLPAGTEFSISFTADARLPQDVQSFTVKLTASDGTGGTRKVEQPCGIGGARFAVTYPEIKLPEGGLTYTVTITPDYEGAPSTTLYGEVNVPTTSYPPVAVIEEFTGTWCVNCPRGAAFLAYYQDTYTGANDNCKAIGIALHDSRDPMYIKNCTYYTDAYTSAGVQGLPSAFFNRTTLADPSDKEVVEEIAATRSNSLIKIDKISYTKGQPLKVDFSVEHSYNMKSMNRRVAFVIVENGVNHDASKYEQSNGFSGITKQSIDKTYGEGLWPYFKFYCQNKELIPAKDMVYNHVARTIYPDYNGFALESSCTAEVPVKLSTQFNMPENVDNPEKTAVIALLLNSNNGEIVSACEVEAEDFNKDLASVESVEPDFATFVKNGHTLSIASAEGMNVGIYGVDGLCVKSVQLPAGSHNIDCSSLSGIMIVKICGKSGETIVRKFNF